MYDTLELLGISPAAARIFRYFLVRPDARPHARELQRILDLGGASLQRELERMVALQALQREEEGRRSHYRVLEGSPVWRGVRLLEGASGDPTLLMQDALVDVPGIQAAFIFGSTATGSQREDSDIDVFVVEEPAIDRKRMLRQLAEVGLLLGREVNAVEYTPHALAERLTDPKHPANEFIHQVLSGPKRWIAGSASAVAPLAIAAGLSAEDLLGSAA